MDNKIKLVVDGVEQVVEIERVVETDRVNKIKKEKEEFGVLFIDDENNLKFTTNNDILNFIKKNNCCYYKSFKNCTNINKIIKLTLNTIFNIDINAKTKIITKTDCADTKLLFKIVTSTIETIADNYKNLKELSSLSSVDENFNIPNVSEEVSDIKKILSNVIEENESIIKLEDNFPNSSLTDIIVSDHFKNKKKITFNKDTRSITNARLLTEQELSKPKKKPVKKASKKKPAETNDEKVDELVL